MPHDRRIRNHRRGLHHLRLAPGAGRRVGDRRQGAAHAPRNRTDHDRGAPARRPVDRRIRKAALSRPPPHRKEGDRGTDRRFLYLQPVGAVDHLQGTVPRRKSGGFLSRPCEQAVRKPGRDLSPALFDQHLPAMVARPAVPHPRPQWRNQHDPRQQELDEEPRNQDGEPRLRRAFGRHQAGDPGRRQRHGSARRGVRNAMPRGPRCADRKADSGPRSLGHRRGHARRAQGDVQLSRQRDGAVGRPRRARDDRWPLGGRGDGPQRAPPAALYADRRQSARRRL